jgi:hypothetical protein
MKKAEKQKAISDAVESFSEALNQLNITKSRLEYAGLNQSAKLLEHYMTRLRGVYDELYDRGTTFVESEEKSS